MAQLLHSLTRHLYSGCATLASVCLLLALWRVGYEQMGELVLPDPLASLKHLFALLSSKTGLNYLAVTAQRAGAGFLISLSLATALGVIVGSSPTLLILMRPFITVMLGVPPIAWIVLALLWFSSEHGAPVFTVVITTFPMVFAATVQGMRTREPSYAELADSLNLTRWQQFVHIDLAQLVSYLFPAVSSALGFSWKVVVMAELLASTHGIGAGLAEARVNIDMQMTMAWISLIVGLLLLVEGWLLNPIKEHVESWRPDASQ